MGGLYTISTCFWFDDVMALTLSALSGLCINVSPDEFLHTLNIG